MLSGLVLGKALPETHKKWSTCNQCGLRYNPSCKITPSVFSFFHWWSTFYVSWPSYNFKSPEGDFEQKWAWSTDSTKFVVWWCTLMHPSMRHSKATWSYRTASSFSGLLCKWACQVCKWLSEKIFPAEGNFCSQGPFIWWALTTKRLSFCSKWRGKDG